MHMYVGTWWVGQGVESCYMRFLALMSSFLPIDWLLYDDEKVTTIKESDVVDSTAYMLFYRHRMK